MNAPRVHIPIYKNYSYKTRSQKINPILEYLHITQKAVLIIVDIPPRGRIAGELIPSFVPLLFEKSDLKRKEKEKGRGRENSTTQVLNNS